MKQGRRQRGGFTLVELIIVIIILGILAALAIPQFTTSTQDAVDSTLAGNLAVMRNAVQLYQAQHAGKNPGEVKEDGTGTASTDAATALAAFTPQMLSYSKANGETSADKDADYPHGPYLQSIPVNPANNQAGVLCVVAATPLATGDVSGTTNGWVYNASTGEIRAINAANNDLVAE